MSIPGRGVGGRRTCSPVSLMSRLAIVLAAPCVYAVTYMVRFKQLTGMISPGLYPRASSTLFMGSWPVNAVARDVKKESNATVGSHADGCRFEIMARILRGEANRSLSACKPGTAREAAATVEVHVSTWTMLGTRIEVPGLCPSAARDSRSSSAI